MMAEAWGMRPWELEREVPYTWVERFLAYKEAMAREAGELPGTTGKVLL